ncbi:MAG: tetratricopeptide repeat protein [Verrucomicrobiaceae bacterium]
MFQSLITIKLAAMASALGLNTSEWAKPVSPQVEAQVQKLEDTMKEIGKGKADQIQESINTTVKAIQELADKGDKDAQYAVGLFLSQSKEQGTLEKVLDYYGKAAAQGQLQAMNNLGFIIASSSKEPEKQKEGINWIKKASDLGNNPARRNMAQIYLNGMAGVSKDVAAAEKLLVTAAGEKDMDADFLLSQFYMGAGGKDKQDDKKGWDYLNKAATGGNANALDALGSLYLQGGKVGAMEIKPDIKIAVDKFKVLAEQKNPVGLRKMATILEQGLVEAGVEKDFKKAFEYYAAAAQGNDAFAQFRLGSFYDTGVKVDPKSETVDVAPNAASALNLYRLAAQNNYPLASYNVGVFYEQGRTVDKDLQKAFAYYSQAAQAGVAIAMQKVGEYYLNGLGTIKDPIAAAGWFARSAASGLPEGHLSYGIVTEAGLVEKDSPFYAAADSYMQAADSVNVSDAVKLNAFVRLGMLYARGVMVPKNDPPKPDYERAFVFLQQAVDVDPKNAQTLAMRDEAAKKLEPAAKKKAEETIAQMKKDREARKAKAEAKLGADTTPVAKPAVKDKEPVKDKDPVKKPK